MASHIVTRKVPIQSTAGGTAGGGGGGGGGGGVTNLGSDVATRDAANSSFVSEATEYD